MLGHKSFEERRSSEEPARGKIEWFVCSCTKLVLQKD